MNFIDDKIIVTKARSKSKIGPVCIWESAYTDTITKPVAYLFALEDGSPPTYIFKRESQSVIESPSITKSWGTKLLCPIKIGMWQCKIKLIKLPNHEKLIEPIFNININRIENIINSDSDNTNETDMYDISLKTMYKFTNNYWNVDPPNFLNKLIEAAKNKVTTFNFEWAIKEYQQ